MLDIVLESPVDVFWALSKQRAVIIKESFAIMLSSEALAAQMCGHDSTN
jgi:hypothetical protein